MPYQTHETVGSHQLPAILHVPAAANGLVVFANGRSRFSPKNQAVAQRLHHGGLATLLVDIWSPAEAANKTTLSNVPLLAQRLAQVRSWVAVQDALCKLPLGVFATGTGTAASLVLAAQSTGRVDAVFSWNGRPDLVPAAGLENLPPTLLAVEETNANLLQLNRRALDSLSPISRLAIVPSSWGVFPKHSVSGQVANLASHWFDQYLSRRCPAPQQAALTSPCRLVQTAAKPFRASPFSASAARPPRSNTGMAPTPK